MDEDVITIEDAEKCLTFYSPTVAQSTITNEKGIREWYDHIQSGIQHMQKKHRLCGICNRNCEYSPSIDNAGIEEWVRDREGEPKVHHLPWLWP